MPEVDSFAKRMASHAARLLFLMGLVLVGTAAASAPYAAIVVDGRDGTVLHARNADTRLHPASLVKMMTLYVAFSAVNSGEISLDDPIIISRQAASEPPSKLGLHAGQTIALRYLIRAAALKSANDAATAIAEGISGSESAFVARMNLTAKRMGLSRTTFTNAHGLTQNGQLSTARDLATLARQLYFDFPEYYNLFSRLSTNAGVQEVHNTNRRLLDSYRGADGLKTGYTSAAGFSIAASAERGSERIFVVVLGGRSTASRNARVAELFDMGFDRAPSQVAIVPPASLNTGPQLQLPQLASRGDPQVPLRPRARPSIPVQVAEGTEASDTPGALWRVITASTVAEDLSGSFTARIGAFDTAESAMRAALTTNLSNPYAVASSGLKIVEVNAEAGVSFSYEIAFDQKSQRDNFCEDLQEQDHQCH